MDISQDSSADKRARNGRRPTLDKPDPWPCELCGCTIDRHERVDTQNGPEFYCDDVERQIYLDASALVKRWEMADPRDRWRHSGEPPPEASDIPTTERQPYRTPQSVVDAFFYLVGLGDADRLAGWLRDHPKDVPTLLKLLESA
jgi:hypothetical protein